MKKKNEEIRFKDLLAIFLPKAWLIAAVAIIFSAILGVHSAYYVEDTYTSTSIFRVKKIESNTVYDVAYAESTIESIRYDIYSHEFLNEVVADINESYDDYSFLSAGYLKSVISYRPQGNGILLTQVTTTNPALSFAIAKALEDELPEEFYEYQAGSFSVITTSNAVIPTAANDKGTVKNAIIGFLVGAILSAGAVWIYSVFDVTIRNKKKIEDNFDLQILGLIPRSPEVKNESCGEVK